MVSGSHIRATEEGDLLNDTRVFHDTPVKAGHDVTYREFRGGHDHACWRGSLADGIADVLSKTGNAPATPAALSPAATSPPRAHT